MCECKVAQLQSGIATMIVTNTAVQVTSGGEAIALIFLSCISCAAEALQAEEDATVLKPANGSKRAAKGRRAIAKQKQVAFTRGQFCHMNVEQAASGLLLFGDFQQLHVLNGLVTLDNC